MKITVTFWGVTQRLAGVRQRALECPTGCTVAQLVDGLNANSALAKELERCAFSVGTQIVSRSQLLSDGDELAVLPPVNGG